MNHQILVVVGILLSCVASMSAQNDYLNHGCSGPAVMRSQGTAFSPSVSPVRVGFASVMRTGVPANQSLLRTGYSLDPLGNGSSVGNPPGFTIQWWYRPTQFTALEYLMGDGSWDVGAGPFRMFAHGAIGTGRIGIRGPLTASGGEVVTSGTPLSSAAVAASGGWVHIALVHNAAAGQTSWIINGLLDISAANSFIGQSNDLTILGYDGSSSPGPNGWIDDFRVYDFARPIGDIVADMAMPAGSCASPVLSPSGDPATPTGIYLDFEQPLTSHVLTIGVGADQPATRTRLVAPGSTISWGGSAVLFPPPSATAIVNLGLTAAGATPVPRTRAFRESPPMDTAYFTPGLPGLEVGHGFSFPAEPNALAVPDGLGLGTIPGLFALSVPAPYTYASPDNMLVVPAGVFSEGDRIDVQFVALDPSWPAPGIASSNRATFIYTEPLAGARARFEARGASTVQTTGFWQLWNTGTVDITRVDVNLGVAGHEWTPWAIMNSGGMLDTNDAYRFGTHVTCGLLFNGPGGRGYTGLNAAIASCAPIFNPLLGYGILRFDFSDFTAGIDHFAFDCRTCSISGGGGYAGGTVTVTFADGTVKFGPLMADPNDPQLSSVDF